MVEVFFIPDNEQDVNYFKWTEDNTFREEFCIELMNSLVKKYGKKVIFDILENPEKMKERFRIILRIQLILVKDTMIQPMIVTGEL